MLNTSAASSKPARIREVLAYAGQNVASLIAPTTALAEERAPGNASKVLARPEQQGGGNVCAAFSIAVTGCEARSYYSFGGQRVAMRIQKDEQPSGAVTWLHSDHLGSASLATDATGTVIAQSRYKPFGEERVVVGGTMPTARKWTGQIALDSIGLVDMNARMYSSVIGRFISADTIVPGPGNPQTFNRYSGLLNNPIKYVDPTGHDPFDDYGRSMNDEANYAPADPFHPYPALPEDGLVHTRYGGVVDIGHAKYASPIIDRVRRATKSKGGGRVTLNGNLARTTGFFEVNYHVAEGLTDDEVRGVALGIWMDYQTRFEEHQPEALAIWSSFSPEDLPSDFLGFYQEATGRSLESLIYSELGGIVGTEDNFTHLVGQTAQYLYSKAGWSNNLNHLFLPYDPKTGHNMFWPTWITGQLNTTPIDSGSGKWFVINVVSPRSPKKGS